MKIQAESSALFEFGQFARLLLLGRGSLSDIEGLIERNTPDRVIRLVKSAQAFASTTDPDFAALSDYNAISTSFLDTLVPWGAFDGMLSSMRRVPLRTPIAISSAAIIGSLVAQGTPKPLASLSLTGAGVLESVKITAQVVLTETLLRLASQQIFMNELRGATVTASDAYLVATIVDSNTPQVSTIDTDASGFLATLAAAAAELRVNARSRLFLLADPVSVLNISLLPADGARAFPDLTFRGGDIGGIQVIPTDAISRTTAGESTMLLVDAQQLAGESDAIVLDATREATIEMEDTPTNPPTGATIVRSLWQSSLRALIAHRWLAVKRLTDTAVCQITGASFEPSSAT